MLQRRVIWSLTFERHGGIDCRYHGVVYGRSLISRGTRKSIHSIERVFSAGLTHDTYGHLLNNLTSHMRSQLLLSGLGTPFVSWLGSFACRINAHIGLDFVELPHSRARNLPRLPPISLLMATSGATYPQVHSLQEHRSSAIHPEYSFQPSMAMMFVAV